MKDRAIATLLQLAQLWRALSTPKRISLVVATLGVIASVLAFSFLSSRESYAFLYTELSAEDASAIVAKLKEMKVPVKVEASGTALLVPEERVHELRLELAGQGLPRGGGVGFEIFDKTHLGATEFEQRINLRRALEGELSRTIGTVAAVHSSRVHLVLPERSVFAIGTQEASASVVLRLRPGRAFGKEEIASVVHLVSSAVPGLVPERVSVVSADGSTLHRPKSDAKGGEMGGAGDGQLEYEHELAGQLEERARALLERVVGPGHADVRIGLLLDTTKRERTEEHYEPSKTALRSEQKTEERAAAEPERVAGVPGALTNLPTGGADVAGPVPGGAAGFRTSWTRNWEVDRVTEKSATPAGRVARLSIAALVDGVYQGAPGQNREFVARDRVELDRLAELVKGAVGYQVDRGDFLQIECARFAADDVGELVQTPSVPPLKRWYVWVGAALCAALALAVVVLLWRGRTPETTARKIALTSVEPAAALRGTAPALLETGKDPVVVRAQALELAAKDPATAAVILRGWLNAPTETVAARF